ncbi:hypothetical protein DUI87_29489 [Hirundo rustica rustica]|uniref:Uncharacterized protein n=1 Tax=Hirundo rustica rustica TaxID=333673 RepID=A0A3M0JH23_HIRRU|nr:hypothetical protein DUI87_29489 [Hirundo rustica rustica]
MARVSAMISPVLVLFGCDLCFVRASQLAGSGHIHGIKFMNSKEGGTSVLPVRNGFLACPSFQAMPKSVLGTYWLVQTKSDLGPISTTGFLGHSDLIMFASTNLASYLTVVTEDNCSYA